MTRHFEHWGDKGTFAWKDLGRPRRREDGRLVRAIAWALLFSAVIYGTIAYVVSLVVEAL